jgi:hypothetical protein
MSERHPYHVGYHARCLRAVPWNNPFPADTWQRHAWQAGWEQCSVDMEHDRIEGAAVDLWSVEDV